MATTRQVFDEAAGWLCEPDEALITAEFSFVTDTVAHELRTEVDSETQFWVDTEAGPLYASKVDTVPYFLEDTDPDSDCKVDYSGQPAGAAQASTRSRSAMCERFVATCTASCACL